MLREYEGHRFVDVRRYYVDRTTKETKPTKKGITLSARVLAEIRDVFDRSERIITDWLQRGDSANVDAVREHMRERQAAADKVAREKRPYRLKIGKWRAPSFFSCESDGDVTSIALNDDHPFVRKLHESNPEDHN